MMRSNWRCTVCGYIHVGQEAPDCCPVCGVTPDMFEPAPDVSDMMRKGSPARWRCINCDYIHNGKEPPPSCPICGVGPEQFESLEEKHDVYGSGTLNGNIVVIGGGIAALSAAEAARRHAPGAGITLLSQEPRLPYYRLNLTRYLAGEIAPDSLQIHPDSWYAEQNIKIMAGAQVTSIDRAGKSIAIKKGTSLPYDRLIIATGAHSVIPSVPGIYRKNVISLRSMLDAEEILRLCTPGTRCVVIGGGVLGLEIAGALALRKLPVTLVEGYDWLLPRQLNRKGGERLISRLSHLGVHFACGAKITGIEGDEQVSRVLLDSAESLPADVVIVAAGVRCNSYLARLSGLEVNQGVVVDQYLCTSDPDIYAAGDVAEFQGVLYGTWGPAQLQGEIAGLNAAGGENIFAGISRSNSLKVIGVDLFSIGAIHPEDASYSVFEEDSDEHYRQFIFRDSSLAGAILLGDISIASQLKKLIESRTSCASLLAKAKNGREIFEGIFEMP